MSKKRKAAQNRNAATTVEAMNSIGELSSIEERLARIEDKLAMQNSEDDGHDVQAIDFNVEPDGEKSAKAVSTITLRMTNGAPKCSPNVMKEFWIEISDNGYFTHFATVQDQSRHSKWKVWGHIRFWDAAGNHFLSTDLPLGNISPGQTSSWTYSDLWKLWAQHFNQIAAAGTRAGVGLGCSRR